jgi:hypothetical protein
MRVKNIKIGNYCPICGTYHEVEVNEEDYMIWIQHSNKSIHELLPYLNSTECEQLIQRLCPKCVNDDFN